MRFRSTHLKLLTGEYLGVAPFINCVFLLLIFLLLTWNYAADSQGGIKVSLPRAITSEMVAEESVVIAITREKVIYLNNEAVSLKELASKLEALPKKSLLIKADRGTSLERVVEVWDICRNAGIPQVNIATTQARE